MVLQIRGGSDFVYRCEEFNHLVCQLGTTLSEADFLHKAGSRFREQFSIHESIDAEAKPGYHLSSYIHRPFYPGYGMSAAAVLAKSSLPLSGEKLAAHILGMEPEYIDNAAFPERSLLDQAFLFSGERIRDIVKDSRCIGGFWRMTI